MKKLTQEKIEKINKKLKNKFNVKVQYLGYNRFALIESHRKAIKSGSGTLYPTIRSYRLSDKHGNIINLKHNYNFITTFAQGAATVIIRVFETSTESNAHEIRKEGLIDIDGKELFPCTFDSISVHLDGFVELKKDGVRKTTNMRDIISGNFVWDKTTDAYYNRGNIKDDLEDSEGNIEDYSTDIEIAHKLAIIYNDKGIAKYELGNYTGAIKDYSKAIEIDPEYAEAYYNRGNAKRRLRVFDGAIEDYSKAIEIDPEYGWAYYNRGDAKYDLDDYKGAREDYSKAIEIDPKHILPYHRGEISRYPQ